MNNNKNQSMFNLILFGPPGSGKGTQAVKIAEKYNFAHISTGDIFRSEIKNKTELGLKVQEVIERGELVPDELLVAILDNAIGTYSDVDGFIFDGFPRTLRQAADFDSLLTSKSQSVSLVLALQVDEEEVIKRLLIRAQLQGRKDDTEDVIRNRMVVYHTQTSPLIDLYTAQNKYEVACGSGTIDEISENLCKIIDRHI